MRKIVIYYSEEQKITFPMLFSQLNAFFRNSFSILCALVSEIWSFKNIVLMKTSKVELAGSPQPYLKSSYHC